MTVLRKTRVKDGQGGFTYEYLEDHIETVRIGAPNGRGVPVVHRKEGVNTFPVYADAGVGVDIQFGDRLQREVTEIYEIRDSGLEVPGGPYLKWLAVRYVPQELKSS